MTKFVRRVLLPAGLGLWLVGVIAAFALVWRYKTRPGPEGDVPTTWPTASAMVPASDRPNLVMFTHPQCPCTRASMAELERLAVELGQRAQIHVVLVRPEGTSAGFEEGVIAERARAIRGARVVVDERGVEAARFGAKTSGATVLYTGAGDLAFHGGVTTARGHEGRGPAHERILAVVNAASPPAGQAGATPTFGCELERAQLQAAR